MARLRKPSPNEPTTFMPNPIRATRATRSSPRKTTRTHSISSADEENVTLVPKSSKREPRYANASVQDVEKSLDGLSKAATSDALTLRKQRVLRPVESNSRLLRKMSDESLASPEKRQRERRVRSGTMDTDVGKKTNLLYAKTLAKSVVKKQASRAKIDVVEEEEVRESSLRKDTTREDPMEVEEDAETSLWCGDEEATPQDKEDVLVVEMSDDEDEGPVVHVRQRRKRVQTRLVQSDSDFEVCKEHKNVEEQQDVAVKDPQPLTSMRLPHRKGHSTISNWAQQVIDLTSSPEAPASFAAPPLAPSTRMRSASFASSRPQTASSNGGLAILAYSPTPTKLKSPIKAPPMSRPVTPPLAPPSPSKLVSPSKKKPAIPKAPGLRPSLDAFWNPEIVNEWNERHSPSKPLVSPKKQKWREDIAKMMEGISLDDESCDAECPSPSTSPRKKKDSQPHSPAKKKPALETASPNVKEVRSQRKEFVSQRAAMAEAFLLELDATVSQGRIHALSKATGGIHLVWSNTLKTTAGRANWRREQIRLRKGPLPTDVETTIRHHCSIELALKIIDTPERLYNVLAHEFCHLTTFMLSGVRNNPHGVEFKAWGRVASEAFAHRGVQVTTKHSYAIEYKYVWECVECGYEFKRHSKSVDTVRHSCGRCKGRLVQTKPAPRAKGDKGEKSEYQLFVKANFARVKRGLEARGESGQMGRVVEEVAREYREVQALKGRDAVGGLEDALDALRI
ncbi:hypothetical protein CC86DRAFT_349463 [Ophiobolus disseminans]|uniref:SprT-like domain-containing protein n=1 Tax=Ophiobolus disseminans TaxID=1469910 RepID=A0A6A7A4K8_9PLEO|nr:hypothetical protein CC86DRAFT_349463 [Ophiobolus disseminans]